MAHTIPTPGTAGTVRAYGVTLDGGEMNRTPIRATYVGRTPSPWTVYATGRPMAPLYALELEGLGRFVIESAEVMADVFTPDAPDAPAAVDIMAGPTPARDLQLPGGGSVPLLEAEPTPLEADGFGGADIVTGARVELAPFTDWWMRGARYGVVLGVQGDRVRVELDSPAVLRAQTMHRTWVRAISCPECGTTAGRTASGIVHAPSCWSADAAAQNEARAQRAAAWVADRAAAGTLPAAPIEHPHARTPIGTPVRSLRESDPFIGRIVGASSAALMVRSDADGLTYGVHPAELEQLSADQYVAARLAAADPRSAGDR